MALCLSAGVLATSMALSTFTLAWHHSIEKVRWEEDWLIESGKLMIGEARIRGSGAGMEPPAGAVLKQGVWHYQPDLPAQSSLRLTHSPYTTGYELCLDGVCRPLADHLPGIDTTTVIELGACKP